MTDPAVSAIIPLEQLIANWRNLRAKAADVGLAYAGKNRGYEAAGCCEALERCADELEAALLSLDRAVHPEAAEIHRDCHDVVCNGDRNQPRGAHGVSCSCQSRYQRMLEELIALKRSAEASDRAVKEQDWQPITDDQKTGHRLLVAPVAGFGEESSGVGYWDRDEESEGGQCWRGEDNERIEPPPTAWMRLPKLAAEGLIASPAKKYRVLGMALTSANARCRELEAEVERLRAEVSSPARPTKELLDQFVMEIGQLKAAADLIAGPGEDTLEVLWRVKSIAYECALKVLERLRAEVTSLAKRPQLEQK